MNAQRKLFAGIDVGSLTAEAVILDHDARMASGEIIKVRPRPLQSAREVLDRALAAAGVAEDRLELCCSTGYGREAIPFSQKNVSEISCHGRGARHLVPEARTVIDVGGQDCKIIRVDADGALEDFVMNDKCAAGTGRFLEMMARTLGTDVSKLGDLALKSRRPLALSSQCAIFAEIEVMQFLYGGKKRKDVAAGLHVSLVRRIKGLTAQVGVEPEVCMTGGVSKNPGMTRLLENELGLKFRPLGRDPQLVGALGAALFARDAWQAKSGERK